VCVPGFRLQARCRVASCCLAALLEHPVHLPPCASAHPAGAGLLRRCLPLST
jgi:hypothetical protein